MAHRLSFFKGCGIFPDQGLNLSPALAGRFFTTESQGKPVNIIFNNMKANALLSFYCLSIAILRASVLVMSASGLQFISYICLLAASPGFITLKIYN